MTVQMIPKPGMKYAEAALEFPEIDPGETETIEVLLPAKVLIKTVECTAETEGTVFDIQVAEYDDDKLLYKSTGNTSLVYDIVDVPFENKNANKLVKVTVLNRSESPCSFSGLVKGLELL